MIFEQNSKTQIAIKQKILCHLEISRSLLLLKSQKSSDTVFQIFPVYLLISRLLTKCIELIAQQVFDHQVND